MKKKKFTVLSVEDNQPDFALLEKAFSAIPGLSLNIINITNGQYALDFIYKKGKYKSAPTPDIIILDINLPLISGQEILETLKNSEKYRIIPIIMFSTLDTKEDIIEAYNLHANSYITKTFDVEELFQKIASLGEYWLKINEPPETHNFCFVQTQIKP